MITIYHIKRSRSMRVVWLMEELGEPYEIEPMSFPLPESYLAVNSLGAIPAIDDDGIVMCESIAILQYITGRRLPEAMEFTVGPNPDPAAYAAHLQFLHYGEVGLTEPLAVVIRTRVVTGDQQASNVTTESQIALFGKRLALLDRRLADGRDWIMGDKFTIADISVGFAVRLGKMLGYGEDYSQPIADYLARLLERPALQRALEV